MILHYNILDLCYSTVSISNLMFRDGKVLSRVLHCCLLNGGIFWLSIVAFEYLLIPGLQYLLTLVLGQSSIAQTVWSWSMPLLKLTFGTLWVIPLFLLSKIINTLYFQVSIVRMKVCRVCIL